MMSLVLHYFLIFSSVAYAAAPGRINHKGKDIFLNGINVAWGVSGFCNDVIKLDPNCQESACVTDRSFFESMVADVHNHGGNSMRLWFHGDGNAVPVVNNDYNDRIVDKISNTEISSIRYVLDLGAKYNVLFNLCLWSFDMVNDNGYGPAYGLWNKIITDETHMNSYIENWLIPMVQEFKNHYNLLSFEVFNEPEGMIKEYNGWTTCASHSSDCAQITIAQAQKFTNRVTSAIHGVSSDIKVTVGSWSYIASSASEGQYGNVWSDSALISAGGKSNGVLDYYQIHYYNWAYPNYSPFIYDVEHWGSSEKAHVMGEFPNDPFGVTDQYFYETLYKHGYAGSWGWAYNDGGSSEFAKQPFLDNMKYLYDTYGVSNWPVVADTCSNNYPYSDGYSCKEQAAWGQCDEDFMASPVCDESCGRCKAKGTLMDEAKAVRGSNVTNPLHYASPHLAAHH